MYTVQSLDIKFFSNHHLMNRMMGRKGVRIVAVTSL